MQTHTPLASPAHRAASILAVLPLILLAPLAVHADTQGAEQAFVDAGCARCHGVLAAGIEAKKPRASDLSHAGATRDGAWIRDYLQRKVRLDDKEHPIAFKGNDDELGALVTWLASLK